MDKKIDLDTLNSILRDHLEDQKHAEILREINNALADEEKDGEKKEKDPPIPKKAVVILTALPEGLDPKNVEDMAGFITEIPEEAPTKDMKFKLSDVGQSYAATRKAKKNPADSLGELFELASGKLFKESGILKKPKGPLEFVFVPNR
jgi:hypothetical protein